MSRSRRELQGGMDAQIQAMCEKIISFDIFINKLVDIMSAQLPAIIENKLKDYEVKVRSLEDRIDQLEQQSRGNNLRIFGLPEVDDTIADPKADVNNLTATINSKLNLSLKSDDVEYCYRLRKGKNGPRPLMIKLHLKEVRELIFRNKNKLKGTKIVVKEDLTSRRYKILLKAAEVFGKTNVWSDGGQIKVKYHGNICKLKTFEDIDKLTSTSTEIIM